jgi:hypothetical protein
MLAGGLVIVLRTMRSRLTRAFASRSCLAAVVVGVLLLAVPCAASATFSGRNGRLLMWSSENARPDALAARPADCFGRPELWSVRPDGKNLTRLGWGDTGIFSPSGRSLAIDYQGDSCWAYEHNGADPSAGLFLSRADGSHRRRIMGSPKLLVGWLPNGRLIVVRKGGRLVDALTGRPSMTVPGILHDEFSISCSGRVAVAREHGIDVFTRQFMRAKGKTRVRTVQRRVAGSPYGFDDWTPPSWSPDGRLLLFARTESAALGPPVDLWTVGPEGQGLRQLTMAVSTPQLISQDLLANWSPDGYRILFDRYQWPPSNIPTENLMVVNADGSAPHIVGPDVRVGQVVWSPDSSSFALSGYGDDDQVGIINATTGQARTIPYEPYGLVDWQALPAGRSVRCADRGTAPFNPKPYPGRG